jgi:hypothetical protein
MSTWKYRKGQWFDPDGNPSEDGPPSCPAMEVVKDDRARAGTWPVLSDAAGVLPEQIPEMTQYLAENGAPDTKFTKDGRVVMEDRDHRRRVLKALDMHDNNSFTGY